MKKANDDLLYAVMHANSETESGDYTGEQYEEAQKENAATPSVTGGGGGVSSWNDLTDKPFGEEKTVLFDEQVTFAEKDVDLDTGFCSNQYDIPLDISEGDVVYVEWDGTEYECVVFEDYGMLCFGNASFLDLSADTGEPFLYANSQFSTYDAPATHTVKVCTKTIKPLDPKYLPESLQFGEKKIVDGISSLLTWDGVVGDRETVYLYSDNLAKISNATPSYEYLFDKSFTATYPNREENDNTFTYQLSDCLEISDDGIYVVVQGNHIRAAFIPVPMSIEGVSVSPGVYAGYGENYGDPWYTSEITGEYEESHMEVTPLDEKYLPALTSPNGTKYKLTVADDGTLSATAI